jgi:hypothetical protein
MVGTAVSVGNDVRCLEGVVLSGRLVAVVAALRRRDDRSPDLLIAA